MRVVYTWTAPTPPTPYPHPHSEDNGLRAGTKVVTADVSVPLLWFGLLTKCLPYKRFGQLNQETVEGSSDQCSLSLEPVPHSL